MDCSAPSNGLQLVGLGVALTFVGVAMLTPLIARPVAAAIGLPVRLTGVPGKLGRENSMRNPRRTAATASALMIGLGLVVFVAVFGASAKASTTAVLERTLKADFILISPTLTGFSTSAAEDARAVPGVDTVSQVPGRGEDRGWNRLLDGAGPGDVPGRLEVDAVQGGLEDLANPNSIAVFDDTAWENDWTVGDTIPVEFPATGSTRLGVVAIYAENGLIGDYAISLDTFDVNVANVLDVFVLIKADEAPTSPPYSRIWRKLFPYPNIEVDDQAGFRDRYATLISQVLNLISALLLFAVIIALFGVMNTLYLSIYERTRELGLLRAVGLTRRQTRSMVRWEAVIVSVMGALFGVVIGIAFGLGAAAGARAGGVQRARDPRRAAHGLRPVGRDLGRDLRDLPAARRS